MRARRKNSYTMSIAGDDVAANMAFFLLENTGSVCGKWAGYMLADDQRKLFGRYLGRGYIVVDGATERVRMIVTVCFGTDWDVRENHSWQELAA